MPSLNAPAWGAIGLTLLFLALTCWWLWQDSAMPYSDGAVHLSTAFTFHDQLSRGDWLGPFTYRFVYPPFVPFVGSLGIFVGGRTVAAPIVAENLVFVPLLALGCYRVGQRAFGPPAGLLAVAFALGAPLIAEQFHVFMIDAPVAALVAAAVWLVLASDRFRRVDLALAAGIVTGLGVISKQSFPLYVVGLLVVVLARGGGWRNVRGIAVFALAALAVAGPWYGYNVGNLQDFVGVAGGNETVPPLAKPPLLSGANLGWYLWALANGLLFLPLLAFALVGIGRAAVETARRPASSSVVPELLGGLAGAWLAITAMPHHDVRYTLPLIVYLAVLGSGWIVRARPAVRTAATAALCVAVVAATLGATFGVGPAGSEVLPGNREGPRGEGVPPLEQVTVYSNRNFMVSGPRHGGDVLGLLEAMRDDGVREVAWAEPSAPLSYVDFNHHGLLTFSEIAQLTVPVGVISPTRLAPHQSFLMLGSSYRGTAPCLQLPDGTGVWILRGDAQAQRSRAYCPRFSPRLYGP